MGGDDWMTIDKIDAKTILCEWFLHNLYIMYALGCQFIKIFDKMACRDL